MQIVYQLYTGEKVLELPDDTRLGRHNDFPEIVVAHTVHDMYWFNLLHITYIKYSKEIT